MWDPYERYFFANKLIYEINKETQNREYYERFNAEYRRQLSIRDTFVQGVKMWQNGYQQMRLYGLDECFLNEFKPKLKRQYNLDEENERRRYDECLNRRDSDVSYLRNFKRGVCLDDLNVSGSLVENRCGRIEKRKAFEYDYLKDTDEKPITNSIWGVINKTHLDEEFEDEEQRFE